jgi:hypothetical protein
VLDRLAGIVGTAAAHAAFEATGHRRRLLPIRVDRPVAAPCS